MGQRSQQVLDTRRAGGERRREPSAHPAKGGRAGNHGPEGQSEDISWSGQSRDGKKGWWAETDRFPRSEEAEGGHLCHIKSPGSGQRLCD